MEISIFGEILATLCKRFEQIEAVVFHDGLGETIDYYSKIDPYLTRVAAAHHGLIFQSTKARFNWLNLGEVTRVSTYSNEKESLTIKVDEDTCITVMAGQDTIDNESFEEVLEQVLKQLREEVGY
jgi:predicted regulator of Ras-like GTPase activity (Roadblock/LC7/MglB family)